MSDVSSLLFVFIFGICPMMVVFGFFYLITNGFDVSVRDDPHD